MDLDKWREWSDCGGDPQRRFTKDELLTTVTLYPREWAERVYRDLRRFTVMPRGGHFAAREEPQLLAEDLRAFFRPLR